MKRRHSREELLSLLENADEIAERRRAPVGEHFAVWSAARAEANIAYDDWCGTPCAERYLIYRAAEDRADAAEVALARVGSIAA